MEGTAHGLNLRYYPGFHLDGDEIKYIRNWMDVACSTHREYEQYILNFSWEV
jgi:hypothetical protein